MFGKRKVRAGAKRKNYRRKRTYRKKTTVNVNRALQPVPQRFIVKMKYAEDVQLNSSGNYQFNLNSVFDPNRTGTGHQPYGHDQFAALFNRYRVVSVGWRICALSSTVPLQVGAVPSNEPQVITSMDILKEQPRAKYVCQNFGGKTEYLTGWISLPSLVGRNRSQYMADDRYQSQVGASPAEAAILNCVVANPQGLPIAATMNVILEYTVEWFDKVTLGQS